MQTQFYLPRLWGRTSCIHAVVPSLQQADLQQADLQQADLQQADLQQADLQQADLQWVLYPIG